MNEFHRLVAQWIYDGSPELMNALLRHAEASAHDDIRRFFSGEAPISPAPPPGLMEEAAAEPAGGPLARARPPEEPLTVALRTLAPETVTALRESAARNRRPLEQEIAVILTRSVRSGREDFASWAAGLRSRLRDRPAGDSTAGIRADRNR